MSGSAGHAVVHVAQGGSVSSTVRGIWSKKVGKVAGVTLTDDATSSAITHVVWSKSTAPAQWLALPVKVVTEAWMVAALQEKRRPLLAMDTEHAFELPVARAPAPEPRPAKRARRSAPIVTSTVLTRLVNASYPYLHANMHLTDVLRVLHKYRFRLGGADKSSRYGTTASGALGRRDYVNQFAIALAMAIAMLTALGEDPEGGIDSVATLQSDRFSRIPYVGASTRALIAEILRRDDGTCEELEKHRDPLYAGFFLDSKGVPRVDEKNEPLQWSYALHELQRVPGIGRGVAMKCIRAGVKTIAALRAHVAAGNAAKLFNDRLVLNHVEEIVLSLSSDDVERIRCSILDALRSGVGSICGGRGRAFVQLDPALWDVRAVGGTRRRPPPNLGVRGPSHDADFLIAHPGLVPGNTGSDAPWFDAASGAGSDGSANATHDVLRSLVQILSARGALALKASGKDPVGWMHAGKNYMRSIVRRAVNKTERGSSNMDQMDKLFAYWRLPLQTGATGAALAARSFGGPRWDDAVRDAGERIVRVDLVVTPWCQRGFALMGWTGSTMYSRILRRWLRSAEYCAVHPRSATTAGGGDAGSDAAGGDAAAGGAAAGGCADGGGESSLKAIVWNGVAHTSKLGFCMTSHGLVNVERAQELVDACRCRGDGVAFGLAKDGLRVGGCTCAYWECVVAGDVNCAAPEERDVFKMLGLKYIEPWCRNCV